ncbi:RES family NAD+ phosphorylase [Planctomycetota bacterium]
MTIGKNPKIFKGELVYLCFQSDVTRKLRYFRTAQSKEFLDAVLLTSKKREKTLRRGRKLWRAQLGSAERDGPQCGIKEDVPYPPERMKPLSDRAKEGRVNPKGIPYLYLATKKQTAVQEKRPWLGSFISVARFSVVRNLKLIDCSNNIFKLKGPGFHCLFSNTNPPHPKKLSQDEIERYVWSWIDWSFSKPVDPSDDTAEYVPTQILAELFRANNYDGIIYNSLFAEGKNLALFDIASAEQSDCMLYRISKIASFKLQKVI